MKEYTVKIKVIGRDEQDVEELLDHRDIELISIEEDTPTNKNIRESWGKDGIKTKTSIVTDEYYSGEIKKTILVNGTKVFETNKLTKKRKKENDTPKH